MDKESMAEAQHENAHRFLAKLAISKNFGDRLAKAPLLLAFRDRGLLPST
jgi:hypothetical protein